MEANVENFISSVFDVKAHFVTHLPALAVEATIFTDLSAELDDELENFLDLEAMRIRNLTGVTIDKENLKVSYINKLLTATAATRGYYLSLNNIGSANKISETKSSLEAMRDSEVLIYGRQVLNIHTPFNPSLIPFGLTAAKVGALEIAKAAYEQAIQSPSHEEGQNVAYHKLSNKCVARLRALMVRIDEAHEGVKDVLLLEFYSYEAARSINDTGGPNVPPTSSPEIPALGTLLVSTNTYNAARRFKFRNPSNTASFLLGLSTLQASMTNPPRLLSEGATSSLLSSTLAPNGDYLLIQNLSNTAVIIDVWVIEP